jgi:hypothetical protein
VSQYSVVLVVREIENDKGVNIMTQLLVRVIFLFFDMVGNASILSNHLSFSVGTVQLDFASSLIVFNALMILIVYAVDFIIVKTQKLLIDVEIGRGFTDHEH